MRRIVGILLVLAFAALAMGLPQQVHEKQHECRDCRLALLETIRHHRSDIPDAPPKPQPQAPCQICAMLLAPALTWTPPVLMVDAGAAAPQIAIVIPCQINSSLPPRLYCRGPPVC